MNPELRRKTLKQELKRIVAQRFGLSDRDADFCADWIESCLKFGNRFIDDPEETLSLQKMDRALAALGVAFSASGLSEGTKERLKVAILSGPHRGRKITAKQEDDWRLYVEAFGQPDLAALSHLVGRVETIRKAIALTVDEVKSNPYRKRHLSQTDGVAMGAVQGCRHVWRYCKGKAPPKALNPTSPFAEFLQEVFDILGLTSDVVSSFNAWKREDGKVHRSA